MFYGLFQVLALSCGRTQRGYLDNLLVQSQADLFVMDGLQGGSSAEHLEQNGGQSSALGLKVLLGKEGYRHLQG